MKKRKKTTIFMLTLSILSSLMLPSAYAKGGSKLIALTFDDGPGIYTEALLDGLKKRGAHVTFFMAGENVEWNMDTVRRAWREGHQICCHTYSHADLTNLSNNEIADQLDRTCALLDKAIGYDLDYALRPPYGSYNQRVLDTVGMPCYYWSVDTRDWESKNEDAAYAEFVKAARDGSIVLMHDIHKTTIPAALRAIDTLKKQGYKFVTLNELMVRRGIEPTAGNIYFCAYPGEHGTDAPLSAPVIRYEKTEDGDRVFIDGDGRAQIYYTLNGKKPNPGNSTLYTGCFPLEEDAEVRAICVYDWNGFVSKSAALEISVSDTPTPTPTPTPVPDDPKESEGPEVVPSKAPDPKDDDKPLVDDEKEEEASVSLTLILLIAASAILVAAGAFALIRFSRPKTAAGEKRK